MMPEKSESSFDIGDAPRSKKIRFIFPNGADLPHQIPGLETREEL